MGWVDHLAVGPGAVAGHDEAGRVGGAQRARREQLGHGAVLAQVPLQADDRVGVSP